MIQMTINDLIKILDNLPEHQKQSTIQLDFANTNRISNHLVVASHFVWFIHDRSAKDVLVKALGCD